MVKDLFRWEGVDSICHLAGIGLNGLPFAIFILAALCAHRSSVGLPSSVATHLLIQLDDMKDSPLRKTFSVVSKVCEFVILSFPYYLVTIMCLL